jgi:acyl-CoA synthetase (AMP-forming)/AMP-acid ligase II
MKLLRKKVTDLASAVNRGADGSAKIVSIDRRVRHGDLRSVLGIGDNLDRFRDKTVLLAVEQLPFSALLTELDGLAGRIVLCPPDLPDERVTWASRETNASFLITDRSRIAGADGVHVMPTKEETRTQTGEAKPFGDTEWLLFTSGTSGAPKLVVHTFRSLTGAFGSERDPTIVWGTFYDVRRYGGLQILLRALVGGSTLILAQEKEPMSSHLVRLGEHGVTHLTGTPSHWRSALGNPEIGRISPRYVRLSGETVDQPILDALKARFPDAKIVHAFAATETGVAFEVHDGLAGFPTSYVAAGPDVTLKIEDGALRMRSSRCALRYANDQRALEDPGGFVDTGDMVEVRGDRCYFLGRRSGVINIGGLKVHPEEIEAVINRHPRVLGCVVRARANPVLGSIVAADVVVRHDVAPRQDEDTFKSELMRYCRDALGTYKTPATIRVVESLELSAAGKLARHG